MDIVIGARDEPLVIDATDVSKRGIGVIEARKGIGQFKNKSMGGGRISPSSDDRFLVVNRMEKCAGCPGIIEWKNQSAIGLTEKAVTLAIQIISADYFPPIVNPERLCEICSR